MYVLDVTYPARSKLKASPSVVITPLSVTFVPEANNTKEAIREVPNTICKACDESPPEPPLRICPLYCTRAITPRSVICSSAAHTHHQLPSKAPVSAHQPAEVLKPQDKSIESSPASSWTSEDTLCDMSTSLRILPRVPRMLGSNLFRPQAPIARKSFSAIAGLSTGAHSPPSPPKEEAAALSTGKSAATYLGTSKRLPEYNLVGKVVLVSGAGRGLGLVQAEALLEAGATGSAEIPLDCSSC